MNDFKLTHQSILKFFLLVFLGSAIYAQTFNDPFHFDDAVTIVENKAVHYLPDWSLTVREILVFQPSRFVTNVTFALNYYFNRLDVFGYHLVNVLAHLITACLVWWLGNLFFRFQMGMPPGKDPAVPGKRKSAAKKKLEIKAIVSEYTKSLIPFLAALLFLVHPANSEAVTYISQRSESLAALFYVAAVCLYIKGKTTNAKNVFYFSAAALSGLLATFSKETAITLPLMTFLIEGMFFRSGITRWGRTRKEWFFIVFLIVSFAVLIPSAFNFNYKKMLFGSYLSQSHLGDVLTLPTYLLTQINVFVTYLRLMVFPVGLNLDHDYPMVHSLFEPMILLNFGLLAGLLLAAIRYRRDHPMLAFAAFWFFLTLSSNFIPRAHVMSEHKVYLALTGTLPALFLGLAQILKNTRLIIIGLSVIILVFGGMTFARNRVWDSDVSLWEDGIRKSPQKARVHLSLGTAYALEGKHDLALKFLTQAIGMTADPHRAYLNRGAVYVNMRRDDLALEDFEKSIRSNSRFLDAYINRGEVFARRKEYAAALEDFNRTIEINGNFASGYKMRGRIFDAMHHYDRALTEYNRALEIEPGDAQVLAWRGYIYAIGGRFNEALMDFNAALRLDPGYSDAYVYRGMYYKDRDQTVRALQDFNKAVTLKPESSLASYQRANLFLSSGDYQESMRDVERAIALDEHFDLPYALRAVLYAQRKEYASALDDFNRALELNPQSFDVYMNRGSLYLLTHNNFKAIEDFSHAIRLNPVAGIAYSKRGGAYGHLGKYALAIADFSKAIELNPRQGSEYFNRSVIFAENHDRSQALKDAVKARELGFPVKESYIHQLSR